MPCRDDGYVHECAKCTKKHVIDMSDADLLGEIEHRKSMRKVDATAAAKRKKVLAAREKAIASFVTKAALCLKAVSNDEIVTFVAAEEGKTETQQWKVSEFGLKLEAWLRACRPLPSVMSFEKATKHHGKWFLHSYHEHKYAGPDVE